MHGEILRTELEEDSFRGGPACEHAPHLESKVIVKSSRVAPLNDEDRLAGCAFRVGTKRLWHLVLVALSLVVAKLGHGAHLYEYDLRWSSLALDEYPHVPELAPAYGAPSVWIESLDFRHGSFKRIRKKSGGCVMICLSAALRLFYYGVNET